MLGNRTLGDKVAIRRTKKCSDPKFGRGWIHTLFAPRRNQTRAKMGKLKLHLRWEIWKLVCN